MEHDCRRVDDFDGRRDWDITTSSWFESAVPSEPFFKSVTLITAESGETIATVRGDAGSPVGQPDGRPWNGRPGRENNSSVGRPAAQIADMVRRRRGAARAADCASGLAADATTEGRVMRLLPRSRRGTWLLGGASLLAAALALWWWTRETDARGQGRAWSYSQLTGTGLRSRSTAARRPNISRPSDSWNGSGG